MKEWSRLKKTVVISAVTLFGLGAIGAAEGGSQPKPNPPAPVPPKVQSVTTKTETTTEAIPFETQNIDDASLASGSTKTQTEGVNGVKTKTWNVTYTNGIETDRQFVKEEVTTAPVTQVVLHGTRIAAPVQSNCDPNYSGGCVPIASDVDCGGGSGNGPAYFYGTATVVGVDIYGLDRDGDGLACE